MKVSITFRHIQASDALKNFVNERMDRLDKYGRKSKEAHVILSTERHNHNAEVVLSSKGIKATGKASTPDMYSSIEEAIGKVEKALRRHHDKIIRSKTHASRESLTV